MAQGDRGSHCTALQSAENLRSDLNMKNKTLFHFIGVFPIILGVVLGVIVASTYQPIMTATADEEEIVCPLYEPPCFTDGCQEAPPQAGYWCVVSGEGCDALHCLTLIITE